MNPDAIPGSTTDIAQVLKERGERYGVFAEHAKLSQNLRGMFRAHMTNLRYANMADDQREAVEMIFHKLARIANGDPQYGDSWRDIAGYATLVADRLEGVAR